MFFILYTLFSHLLHCRLIDYASTLYGTQGYIADIGALPTGVQHPFGLVRLGPDSVNKYNAYIDRLHAGGFYYSDYYIRVFSHLHMQGPGLPDYGNIGVIGYSSQEELVYSKDIFDYNYKSKYSIQTASPGLFEVELTDTGIEVSLTSTKYVGIHKYTYKNKWNNYVMFSVSHGVSEDGCDDSYVKIDIQRQLVKGWVMYEGDLTRRIGGIKVYFVAGLDKQFKVFGVWNNGLFMMRNCTRGKDVGGVVKIDNESTEVYVAISFISIEQAEKNLFNDVYKKYSGNYFSNVFRDSQELWEKELSLIKVKGGSEEQRRTFYSLFYRALTAPTLFSEAGGKYLGFDKNVHTIPEDSDGYYTDMSIWDVHRTQFPLLALIKPKVMNDIVRSLILMYQQGGMIGQHAMVVISDAFQKGIRNFDSKTAYQGLKDAATKPQKHAGRAAEVWINYGYYPDDEEFNVKKSACHTLSSSYDDGCLALFAKALNIHDDYEMFLNRSKGYKHVFNSKYNFFCPVSKDRVFDCPHDFINIFDHRYVEGDAWHWRFFVPHDVEGLIDLFGNKDVFVNELEVFMKKEFEYSTEVLPNPYFWVGNEHNLLSPWLFNFANRSDLTQKYTRKVLSYFYNSSENGCPGNDDFGTTSSWGTWAMLGFYPVAGSTVYSIGSPVFESIEITTPTNKISFEMHNYDEQNIYIDRIVVNGKEHSALFYDHNDDFLNGDVKFDVYMTKH